MRYESIVQTGSHSLHALQNIHWKPDIRIHFIPQENCLISGLFLYAIHCMIWFWGRTAINRIILISGVIITGFQCVSYHYAELAVFRAICDGLKGHSL